MLTISFIESLKVSSLAYNPNLEIEKTEEGLTDFLNIP